MMRYSGETTLAFAFDPKREKLYPGCGFPNQERVQEPEWSDKNAFRTWLEQRYPLGPASMGSPLYQYMQAYDEFRHLEKRFDNKSGPNAHQQRVGEVLYTFPQLNSSSSSRQVQPGCVVPRVRQPSVACPRSWSTIHRPFTYSGDRTKQTAIAIVILLQIPQGQSAANQELSPDEGRMNVPVIQRKRKGGRKPKSREASQSVPQLEQGKRKPSTKGRKNRQSKPEREKQAYVGRLRSGVGERKHETPSKYFMLS